MTLMFTQGHRVMCKLELVQLLLFYCKAAWSNSDVHDGWLWKENDCEDDCVCEEVL